MAGSSPGRAGFVRGATTDTLALLKDLGAGVADVVLYKAGTERHGVAARHARSRLGLMP